MIWQQKRNLELEAGLRNNGAMQGTPSQALMAAAAELLHEEFLQLGLDHLTPTPVGSAPAPAGPSATVAPSTPAAPGATDGLAALAAEIASCRLCGLCGTREQTVPGEGHAQARVVFVGEAPGADEDQSGRPFVGRAGQLLTKIIEQGMGLPRSEVFIANVLKCRPPGNRDPQADEKSACTPYLERQIHQLQPEILIALGRHAANHLLGTDQSLGSLRGRLHQRAVGPPILVTYHPAYLLRTPAAKADCWSDIQLAMQHLGLSRPNS
jgi:uracil-DNA glycosylase